MADPRGILLADGAAITGTITDVARSGTTATITVTGHSFYVGQKVRIALSAGNTGYAALIGDWVVVSVPGANTFTFTTGTTGTISTGAGTGTATALERPPTYASGFRSPVASGTGTITFTFPFDGALNVRLPSNAGEFRKTSGGTSGANTIDANVWFGPIWGKKGELVYISRGGATTIDFAFEMRGEFP